MKQTLIRNAIIVNEGTRQTGDLLVENGRISKIANAIDMNAKHEIDANGAFLIPGMIDDQVHFRDPGLTHKGDIFTESRAAVAGGITSFMDMPNTIPPTLNMQAVEDKLASAKGRAMGNFAFHFGVSLENTQEVLRLDPKKVAAVKIFMGASTGNMLVDDPVVLETLFAESNMVILTHCENTPMADANLARIRQLHGDGIGAEWHPIIRDQEVCYASSQYAVELAKKYNTRLHVLHLTTAKELALFSDLPMEQKRITAEVCVHHLLFEDSQYQDLGNFLKCNPAVKSRADRDALRAALNSNRLDIIATDHAPHTLSEKQQPYLKAPAGLPLAQQVLPGVMELVHEGIISMETLVQKTSHNVAKRFDILDRGYLREGYFADLVLIDPNIPTPQDAPILSRCGWSPFKGTSLRSSVSLTVVNGEPVWQNGQLKDVPSMGESLQFDR